MTAASEGGSPQDWGAPKDEGDAPKDEEWVPQGWGRGAPKVAEELVNGGIRVGKLTPGPMKGTCWS